MNSSILLQCLVIGTAAFLTACSGPAAPTGSEPAKTAETPARSAPSEQAVVNVGYLRLLSGAPLYAAVHEGYFSAEGLDVNLRVIKSGPEGNEALAAGNLDVAFSILPSLVVARMQGVPDDLVSIYGASIDSPEIRDHRIVIASGSGAHSISDLRGKKLAVVGWPGRTSDVLELLDYLARHGMSQRDVTLVGMGHGDMVAAVLSGAVDAAACAEPYVSLAVAEGSVKTLGEAEGYYYRPDGETEVTTYLARKSWVDGHSDVAVRFVRALDRGRVKAEDREWLMDQGLPTFNLQGNPPIDFVNISAQQARGLRLSPIHPAPTLGGLQHVSDQLQRWGPLQTAPADLASYISAPAAQQ